MRKKTQLSPVAESRLGRYAILAGAAMATGVPAQAGVVTVVLPTPIDVRNGYTLDLNGDSVNDFQFTAFGASGELGYVQGLGSNFCALPRIFASAFQAIPLANTGFVGGGFFWQGCAGMGLFSVSVTSYLGLDVPFVESASTGSFIHHIYGFAQFDPFMLTGYAFESNPDTGINVFEIPPPASAPEPGTGALALLALGAAAVTTIRKRREN